jgi:hypothetical protein
MKSSAKEVVNATLLSGFFALPQGADIVGEIGKNTTFFVYKCENNPFNFLTNEILYSIINI